MRTIAVLLALTFAFALPASAQFKVQTDSGETVSIGPGGIKVHGKDSDVNVGLGGIKVHSTDSDVNVGLGGVKVNRHNKASVSTSTLSLPEKLAIIERAAYGQPVTNKPLFTRIEDLEVKVLGHKTAGDSVTRVNALAKAVGVSFTAAPSTVVTTNTNHYSSSDVNVSTTGGSNVVTLNGDNTNQNITCNNSTVVVNSNNCHLKLNGPCDKLIVNGNNNSIDGDAIALLQANGNYNRIKWRGATPFINDVGTSNLLSPAQ